ncbi:ABC transporter permease [Flavobacterium silvaticum]|uniref:ABC transporter permease n=1 Tax=Flavobacterium silvaticum TaxID=1852020 RepID=A0A972JIR6_9FLAO|nr:ABC transporter permease [Flavobacterium silvaticum]NMH29325.1 ABC transporter permease [Flavobacterium silvaticum]
MSVISLVIKREFIAKVRNKSFIVMTFLSPLIFAGIALLIGYLSTMKADVRQIAIHDETGWFVNSFKSDSEYRYINQSDTPVKTLTDSVKSGFYEGVLVIPNSSDPKFLEKHIQYFSEESPGIGFIEDIEDLISDRQTKFNLENAKLDTLAIRKAESKVSLSIARASGEESVKGLNEIKIGIGGAFGYLIMMFIIIYGNMVMRSVIEEKTNRIIEIIISSVKPFQLMIGKIIGTSLAGLLQFAIWALIGMAILFSASLFFDVTPATPMTSVAATAMQPQLSNAQLYLTEIWKLPIATTLIAFLLYFIGGYFLYSSFYAAIGAAVDSETDSQQFMLPIILPLVLGVYIGFFTVINDPHGTIATVFSFVPLTSPIVMLMRIPFGVPIWQIALSITILFATFFGVVWFAAKIYRIGILMYGKKPSWKEMVKWLKY